MFTVFTSSVQKLSFGKIGFSKAMSNKWIRVDKAHEGGPRIFKTVCALQPSSNLSSWLFAVSLSDSDINLCVGSQVESIDDQVREKLLQVQKGSGAQLEEKEKNELKKRKLLSEVYVHSQGLFSCG